MRLSMRGTTAVSAGGMGFRLKNSVRAAHGEDKAKEKRLRFYRFLFSGGRIGFPSGSFALTIKQARRTEGKVGAGPFAFSPIRRYLLCDPLAAAGVLPSG